MTELEEKRRLARAVRSRMGRGLAESCGFSVLANPGSLFQILYLSILLANDRNYQRAVRTAKVLRDRGWESAAQLAASPREERVGLIKTAGHQRDAGELAGMVGDLAQKIVDRYRGDLRRLRTDAKRDPGRERDLLKQLPGVNDRVVDLFFQEVQVVWPEVGPFADRRALAAARKLDLGRSVADLSGLAGGGRESEKLAWLAGALARVDLENRYDEVRATARA